MPGIPHYPTELIEAIIDHWHNDKQMLLNCSLVCSGWLDASRYHLFRRIRVRNERSDRNMQAFISFLEATPSVHSHIRDVSIRVYGPGALPTRPAEVRCIGPYAVDYLLRTLPHLHELTLENISWDRRLLAGPDGRAVDAWPPQPKPFGKLTLARVITEELLPARIFRLDDAIELFHAFSPLGALHIVNMHLEFDQLQRTFPEAFRLHEFYMRTNYTRLPEGPALDVIHTALAKDLRMVDMQCRSDEEAEAVGRFMRALGPSLEDLRLDFSDLTVLRAFNAPGPWHLLSLPALTHLQSLTLHVWTSGAHITGDLFTYDGQWCLCSLAPILAYAPPPLRRLHLILSVSGYRPQLRGHLDGIDCARLQQAIERFQHLHTAVLEVRPRMKYSVLADALDAVAELAERKLAALINRGLLEVCIVDDIPVPPRGER